MNIEQLRMIPTEKLRPYDNNPRINDKAIETVANSIREFGFQQPIVVDKDMVIIVGHTRWKAATALNLEMVPVYVAEELTPEQCRAYRIADNKSYEMAEWDMNLLPEELLAIHQDGFDLMTLGFSDRELDKILGAIANPVEEESAPPPEPLEATDTRVGDIWVLGGHRVMCGDSAISEHVDKLMGGSVIHLVNTDPPYNVAVESRGVVAAQTGQSDYAAALLSYKTKQQAGRNSRVKKTTAKKTRPKDRALLNDFLKDEAFRELLYRWFSQIERLLVPGRAFYVWGGWTNLNNYPAMLMECNLRWSQQIIWVKEHPVLGRKDFMLNHEQCFYGWREGAAHEWFGPKNISDVWSIKKVHSSKMVHHTEKPVELARRALEYSSRRDENVLDLFGGSGSTLIACEEMGRKCFMMELDPHYLDVIVRRWEAATGKKGERVERGPEGVVNPVAPTQQEESDDEEQEDTTPETEEAASPAAVE